MGSVNWVALAALVAPPLGYLCVFLWREFLGPKYPPRSSWEDFPGYLALGLVICILPAGAWFAWQINIFYGLVYGALIYGALFLIFATDYYNVPWRHAKWVTPLALVIFLALGVTVFPFAILPTLRPKASRQQVNAGIDLAVFSQSADQIQRSMTKAVSDIQGEQQRLDVATQRLLAAVAAQNTAIKRLEGERAQLAEQVRYQTALASLTKPQADAIAQSLTRGKYIDYFLGFLIGVASSVTATLGMRLLAKRRANVEEAA